MFAIRIQLSKTDNARFISHLDLMRTMTRALKRADIPVKYTKGFNPHPYLVFSSPLSLGISSTCELLDITLEIEIDTSDIVERLNKVLPYGIHALMASESKRSFNDITYARYELCFPQELKSEFISFIEQANIFVQKKAKKGGFNTLDLKPDIHIEEMTDDTVILILPCGNTKNIGINLFVDAFKTFANITDKPILTKRLDFLDNNMERFE